MTRTKRKARRVLPSRRRAGLSAGKKSQEFRTLSEDKCPYGFLLGELWAWAELALPLVLLGAVVGAGVIWAIAVFYPGELLGFVSTARQWWAR